MAYLLLIAGHETTVNLIGNAVLAPAHPPPPNSPLCAPTCPSPGAAPWEEALRWEGPVETSAFRYAAEPLEIGGVRIERGDRVLVGLTAAQRDAARYAEPDRFDIRRDTRGHLASRPRHPLLPGRAPGPPGGQDRDRHPSSRRAPGLTLDGEPGEWLPGMLM